MGRQYGTLDRSIIYTDDGVTWIKAFDIPGTSPLTALEVREALAHHERCEVGTIPDTLPADSEDGYR